MSGDSKELTDFDGTARLFPLPNLVLFPGVVQGLHIFEPRYRQMTADALAGDGLITLVALRPGWERDYEGRPAIESVGCLGRIVWHERLIDGRYNLRLRGLARVRILEEVPSDRLYRVARVEVIPETAPCDLAELKALRRNLAEVALPRFADEPAAHRQVQELFDSDLPLGPLCDILLYAMPLPVEFKQAMLEEADAARRATALTDLLRPRPSWFPPSFSEN
jgi:Lon protease-like protein